MAYVYFHVSDTGGEAARPDFIGSMHRARAPPAVFTTVAPIISRPLG
jgi:hypothetical protein